MIKIDFVHYNYEVLERLGKSFTLLKEFKDLDEFLNWYFKDGGTNYFIGRIVEGQEIITGEIKQKGINNK